MPGFRFTGPSDRGHKGDKIDCQHFGGNIFNGFNWNHDFTWHPAFSSYNCVGDECFESCASLKKNDIIYPSADLGNIYLLPYHLQSSQVGVFDYLYGTKYENDTYVAPSFYYGFIRSINASMEWFRIIEGTNGKDSFQDRAHTLSIFGPIFIAGGIQYNAALSFYREYLDNSKPQVIDQTGDPELTLAFNDDFRAWNYLSNQWPEWHETVPENSDQIIDAFKLNTGWADTSIAWFEGYGSRTIIMPRAFPSGIEAKATYSVMGMNSMTYSPSDPQQSWLEITPVLTFSGGRVISLTPQSYRCHDQKMLPLDLPEDNPDYGPFTSPFEDNAGTTITQDGNVVGDPPFKVYRWDLHDDADLSAGSVTDASLVEEFAGRNIMLEARATKQGALEYRVIDLGGSGLPESVTERRYEISPDDAISFGLDRTLDDPGYDGQPDVYGAQIMEVNALEAAGIDPSELVANVNITIEPYLINADGSRVNADGIVTVTQTGANLDGTFNVSIDPAGAEAAGYITEWDPAADDELLKLNGGHLLFTVTEPDRVGSWPSTLYREAYAQEVARNSVSTGTGMPLFTSNGTLANPDLLVYEITSSVHFADGSAHANAVPVDGLNIHRYEDAALDLQFVPSEDYSNFVALKPRLNFASTRQFFDINVYQNKVVYPVASEIDNADPSSYTNEYYWNAGHRGGEMQFTIKYYSKDALGAIVNEVIYGQTGFTGYLIGEDVYGTDDNQASHSPFRKVELVFNSPSGDKPSFDETQVSSVAHLSRNNLFITGFGPGTVIDRNTPLMTATPSPVTFESGRRPSLYYRLMRQEVFGSGGEPLVSSEDLMHIYHVDTKTGVLTDISTGGINAMSYENGLEFGSESDPAAFNSNLVNNTEWDYLELTGVPSDFGVFVPLRETMTILDKVELDEGSIVDPGQNLNITGKFTRFIPSGGGVPVNPQAAEIRVLVSFRQGLTDRSVSAMMSDPEVVSRTIPVSGDEQDISIDDIAVPAGMNPGDTVFVYGFPYDPALADQISFAVSLSIYIVRSSDERETIFPVLESVIDNCDGTFTAFFGYRNLNPYSVIVNTGSQNLITGEDIIQITGQPETFLSGLNENVFSVGFRGADVLWLLDGKSVSAPSKNAVRGCAVDIPGNGIYEVGPEGVLLRYHNSGFQHGMMFTIRNVGLNDSITVEWMGVRDQNSSDCMEQTAYLFGNGAQVNNVCTPMDEKGDMYIRISAKYISSISIVISDWFNGPGCGSGDIGGDPVTPTYEPLEINGSGDFNIGPEGTTFIYNNSSFHHGMMFSVTNLGTDDEVTLEWTGARDQNLSNCDLQSEKLTGNGAQINNVCTPKDVDGKMQIKLTGKTSCRVHIDIYDWLNGQGCM